MYDLELSDTVAASSLGGPGGEGYIVGSPPIWKDDSDATYAEIAGSYNGPGEPQFAANASASVVTASLPRLPVRVVANIRMAATLGTGVREPRVFLVHPSAGFSNTTSTTTAPTAAGWRSFELTTSGGVDAWEWLRDEPDGFEFSVHMPFYSPAPLEIQRLQIYEATVSVVFRGAPPPARLFPREDGLGVGGGRIYPPPKSQQLSGRRFGHY